ncbi:MAG: response regulator transcription factor [Coriobacteriales bacterium]|jgi:two-component system alkaline phosphatase synthesis response regulator PhoP|nr:response regulator transcription factor [Coriobacteriales bacterium]
MIYYVEDDENIRNLAVYALEQAGLQVRGFERASQLYKANAELLPELFLLDIMLPEEDGIAILKQLRAQPATALIPVMMITAKSAEYDVVLGLDSGADDYLTKPFGMMELVSRVNALLRRGAAAGATPSPTQSAQKDEAVHVGPVALIPNRRQVLVGQQAVSLTFKEFELLRFLMENVNLVFTRDHLLESIWGWDFGVNSRTVDVHIQTLRQKLGEGASIIQTVRGVGYRVSDDT